MDSGGLSCDELFSKYAVAGSYPQVIVQLHGTVNVHLQSQKAHLFVHDKISVSVVS